MLWNSFIRNTNTKCTSELARTVLVSVFVFILHSITVFGTALAGWSQLTSGTANNLKALHFSDANIGYAVGENGTILKTINGGTHWISQSIGGATLNSVSIAPAGTSYEDFLAYTENDPSNIVTVKRYNTSTNGSHASNTNSIVYRDYGAGFFNRCGRVYASL